MSRSAETVSFNEEYHLIQETTKKSWRFSLTQVCTREDWQDQRDGSCDAASDNGGWRRGGARTGSDPATEAGEQDAEGTVTRDFTQQPAVPQRAGRTQKHKQQRALLIRRGNHTHQRELFPIPLPFPPPPLLTLDLLLLIRIKRIKSLKTFRMTQVKTHRRKIRTRKRIKRGLWRGTTRRKMEIRNNMR